jgi:hypothetical protein
MQKEIRSSRGDSVMYEIPLKVGVRLNETGLTNAMAATRWLEMNVGGFTEVLCLGN